MKIHRIKTPRHLEPGTYVGYYTVPYTGTVTLKVIGNGEVHLLPGNDIPDAFLEVWGFYAFFGPIPDIKPSDSSDSHVVDTPVPALSV